MKVRKRSEHEKGMSKGLRSSLKGPAGHIWDHLSFKINSMHTQSLSYVWPFVTLWTVAHQAPLSMGFSRQEHWSGFPFPPPGGFPNARMEAASPASAGGIFSTEPLGTPLGANTHWPKQATVSSDWRTLNDGEELWRMDTYVVSPQNTYLWPRERHGKVAFPKEGLKYWCSRCEGEANR